MLPGELKCGKEKAVNLNLTNRFWKEHGKEYLKFLAVGHLCRLKLSGMGPFLIDYGVG